MFWITILDLSYKREGVIKDSFFFLEKIKGLCKIPEGTFLHIRFTHEMSRESVSFLDLNIKLEGENIKTDMYCKPMDRYQYLHYKSTHPLHSKRSIVYS